jgi:hypothetical protein
VSLANIVGAKRIMSGRQRLPGGEPRKASQRNTRRAASAATWIALPIWRPGDSVRWKGRAGLFRRDVGDGEHCEIVLEARVYQVRTTEIE